MRYQYKKAGVMLTMLSSQAARQETLFDDPLARARSARLMAALDTLNQTYGHNTLRMGVCGTAPRWGRNLRTDPAASPRDGMSCPSRIDGKKTHQLIWQGSAAALGPTCASVIWTCQARVGMPSA